MNEDSQMRSFVYTFAYGLIFVMGSLSSDEVINPEPVSSNEVFTPFTGIVKGSKVRMRLGAHLDAPIVNELEKGTLLLVRGKRDDYYQVAPASDTKAYVFRTFVLDGLIEGSHVNVRLKPDLDANVIAQLNTGDVIDGKVCPFNNKWIEFPIPKEVSFYVATDFIDHKGDENYLSDHVRKESEGAQALLNAKLFAEKELTKPFMDVDFSSIQDQFDQITNLYSDYEHIIDEALGYYRMIQDEYVAKKVQFRNALFKKVLSESVGNDPDTAPNIGWIDPRWLEQEGALVDEWLKSRPGMRDENFYLEETRLSMSVKGVVKAYDKPVYNKPGDYVLIGPQTQIPLAYLYSTHVNLSEYLDETVEFKVSSRPNNHFAFPAYYVLGPNKAHH